MPAWHMVRAIQKKKKQKQKKQALVLIILTQPGVVTWECDKTVELSSLTPMFHLQAPLIFHTSKVSFAAVASSVLVPSFMTCGLVFLLFTCSLHLSSLIMSLENHGDSITKLAT